MPTAKRFAPWLRFAGRPLPALLLVAQGMTLPATAAQDAATDPPAAAVLRVARDQPRLDAPRQPPKLRPTESSRRTANSPTLSAPALTAPTSSEPSLSTPPSSSPSVASLTLRPPSNEAPATVERDSSESQVRSVATDGWVSRGSVRAIPAPASTDSAASRENASLSNSRALALQEQNERFEAEESADGGKSESDRREAAGSEPRFVEIVPESIEPSAVDDPEPMEMPVRHVAPLKRPVEEVIVEEVPLEEVIVDELPYDQPSVDRSRANDRGTNDRGTNDRGSESIGVDSLPAQQLDTTPAPVISAAALRLKRPIEQSLQYYHQRPEDARERTPWGMLHAILPYGLEANVDSGNRRYNAIAWLAGNNPLRNLKLLTTTPRGQIEARIGVGLQGHQAQLLAIFAQVGVPENYPLYVGNRQFTVADLVASEMAACRAGEELTFTLMGLSHYLPTDATWTASDGRQWDFEKLIREELQQPVVGAACGGTHRLMGLNYALVQRRLEGAPVTGQWERAAIFIDDFVAYTWQLQNRDGSFSTKWFEGREDNNDLDRKVQTSGHILEWLVFNATPEQLQDDRMVRGMTFLTNAMLSNRGSDWEVGPKGHAIRALSLYHRRVFNSQTPWQPSRTAATSRGGRR